MYTRLVTGASRGLGRAIALELARRGHLVVASMRDPAMGAELDGLHVIALDVTDEESVRRAVAETEREVGRIDVLVNNAAVVDFFVNVSSIGGRMAPFSGLYMIGKHGLEAASEALAMEVRPYDIRVAVVEPGFHATRMLDDATSPLGLDPRSPYADAERRIVAWFAQSKQSADPADVDAAVCIDGRPRLSDETWIDLGRAMTDDEFFARFAELFAPGPAR